jgi:Arc/MetJ-type ribon-helix-helix transcriptional regulator
MKPEHNKHRNNENISVRLNTEMIKAIDDLVSKNHYMSRSDTIRDLIRRGLEK